MERSYQLYYSGLPIQLLFVMLLKAFADFSAGKVVKAKTALGIAGTGRFKRQARRPIRGRRGLVLGKKLSTTGWRVILTRLSAAPGAARRPSQSPSYIRCFRLLGARWLRLRGWQEHSVTGWTERTLSPASPFVVGGQQL